MSLQTAAEAVRQKGRGEDTMLIHMTPGEVKGLQQLAMAYGGSLTLNPETGLPEASFLKSLLPTLIGAGLTIFSGGAINPLTAGLITGGIETVRTGDIGRGLMAGLGAYGGAGFGSALTGAGQAAGAQAAQLTPQQIAQQTAQSQNVSSMARSLTPMETAIYNADKGSMITGGFSPVASSAATSPLQSAMAAGSGAGAYTPATTAMGQLSQAGTGLGNILGTTGTEATQAAARSAGMEALGGSATSAAMRGAAALAGPLAYVPPAQTIEPEEYNYDGPYLPTERKVRFPTADRDPMDSSEFQYFDTVNPYPGFQTAPTPTPLPQNTYGPDAPRFAGIPVSLATNPDRMREYQANPNLYSFAEGGAADAGTTAQVSMPPSGYRAGMEAEFDYGFRPMAANVPEIQQEAAVYNPVARERYGFTPGDGGENRGASQASMDMGYVPGFVAGIGRTFNDMSGLEKALIPGAMIGQGLTDNVMSQRGYAYNPTTGDYEQRDYMGGGSEGYTTVGQDVSQQGGRANRNEDDPSETFFRAGGMMMDNGGFVVDAHTVSEIGNGSSDAGHERLAKLGGEPIEGLGDGVSDSIKANIGGVQEARIARDESYLSRDDVKALGGGDLKKGEKMLYQLMAKAHESRKQKGRGQATGLDKLISRMA